MKTSASDETNVSAETLKKRLLLLEIKLKERELEKASRSSEGKKMTEFIKEKLVDYLQFALLLLTTFFPSLVPTKPTATQPTSAPISQPSQQKTLPDSPPAQPSKSESKGSFKSQQQKISPVSTLADEGKELTIQERINLLVYKAHSSKDPLNFDVQRQIIVRDLQYLKNSLKPSEKEYGIALIDQKIAEINQSGSIWGKMP